MKTTTCTPPTALICDSEPEDHIAQALYLLQLCQQDLNMGRKSTIWPRARRAREACQALESMFSPNATSSNGTRQTQTEK